MTEILNNEMDNLGVVEISKDKLVFKQYLYLNSTIDIEFSKSPNKGLNMYIPEAGYDNINSFDLTKEQMNLLASWILNSD